MHQLDEGERAIDAYFHMARWLEHVATASDHSWSDSDFVFPALSQISKTVSKSNASSNDKGTGCENVRTSWGKKMSEQVFITVFNCIVRDFVKNRTKTPGYVPHQWRNIWFTSHTFRRAGAQYWFMLAAPERRWSLRMVKWWAGWTPNESAETLVRYLLDQSQSGEDNQLADCLAPDRKQHVGCPTTHSGNKRSPASSVDSASTPAAIEKRLRRVENSLTALSDKIDVLVSLLRPGSQPPPAPTATNLSEQKTSVFPPAKGWKDLCSMYWRADPSRHLYKPIAEWTNEDKKRNGASRSRVSVAKLIAKDVAEFASRRGLGDPSSISDDMTQAFIGYYSEHWQSDEAISELDVFTIDTLARYIRLDKKRRITSGCHAYLR